MNPALSSLLQATPVDWHAVLDAIIQDFAGTTGTLHRLDPATQTLHLLAQRGVPPQLMPVIETIPVGKGIAGAAAARREPVELCNLQQDLGGVARESARQTQVQGSIAVPVEDDALRGTLGVGMMTPHEFTDEEKARLADIASRLAPLLAG